MEVFSLVWGKGSRVSSFGCIRISYGFWFGFGAEGGSQGLAPYNKLHLQLVFVLLRQGLCIFQASLEFVTPPVSTSGVARITDLPSRSPCKGL